jgi:hypothetical protein
VRLLEAIRVKNSQLQVSRASKDAGGTHMPMAEAKADAETPFKDPTNENVSKDIRGYLTDTELTQ